MRTKYLKTIRQYEREEGIVSLYLNDWSLADLEEYCNWIRKYLI